MITLALALGGCGPGLAPELTVTLDRAGVEVPGHPGRVLSYLRAGDPQGRRVIFVHGTPGDAENFAHMLADPPPGLEMLSVDRLGFGRSVSGMDARGEPSRAEVLSYAEQAAALAPLLVTRDGRGTILVGHSLGGPIVAQAAADYPNRVAGLVILAGSLDPDLERPQWYNQVLTWAPVRAVMPGALIAANREVLAGREQTTALAPRLAEIRCPVTIVHGVRDSLVPYENVSYMQRTLTHAPRRIINFALEDHFLPWTQPGAIRSAIVDLDRSLNAPGLSPGPAGGR